MRNKMIFLNVINVIVDLDPCIYEVKNTQLQKFFDVPTKPKSPKNQNSP